MSDNLPDVIVVGSGPTGLMLSAELQLGGADVLVLERRATPELVGSRGGGFHSRTIELLDQRGIAEPFLAKGTTINAATFAATTLDLSRLPTRHPYTLALFQNHIERLLLEWVERLGVVIHRGVEVTGLQQDAAGVEVGLATGRTARARYVVGADGGRSTVRRAAGIDSPGTSASRSSLIAEVAVTEDLPPGGAKVDARGIHGLHPMGDGCVRVVVTEPEIRSAEPTVADLGLALREVFGTDFGVHDPRWLSRFTDATRQAAAYRQGRVLLAGDAAHVHSPTGGLGIGLGVQDAVNLGWKLAQVVTGTSENDLLDSYHAERHPAGARALRYTMAQSLFQKADPRQDALRDLLDEVMVLPDANLVMAALVAGLDVAYDLGPGHPLLGRRMPDLDLGTADGQLRVYDLLRDARHVLLNLSSEDVSAPSVRCVRARYDGPWVLPVLGEVPAPSAVLIRPDGHVAWVGEGSTDGLAEALSTWCGARR